MALLSNFINIRLRGLILGQQWQSSFNYGVTGVSGVGDAWTFTDAQVAAWFDTFYNGGGGVPVGGGIVDLFRNLASPNVTIEEVRVLARNEETMALPVQLVYTGAVPGTLPTSAEQQFASFISASFTGRKDDYGGRGAAIRLPFGNEQSASGQNWTTAALDSFQAFADAMTDNAALSVMEVVTEFGDQEVLGVLPCVVESVLPVGSLSLTKDFPYTDPYPIRAHTLVGWAVKPTVATQISRKLGRGN